MKSRPKQEPHFGPLLDATRKIIDGPAPRDEKLLEICKLLKSGVPHYDWVGFYLREPADAGKKGVRHLLCAGTLRAYRQKVPDPLFPVLVLGPFVGEPTEHVRIPFGRGICGQAAERRETFVAQDVSKEANYLACSAKAASEIVVPILKDGEVAGELDIDSHRRSPFTGEDREFLEEVCNRLARLF